MSMRTYRPMRLAPTVDPLVRSELQGVDVWLRQLSTQQARTIVAPQGTPSAGSSTVDLSKYLFLPGRSPEQRAEGTIVVQGKSQSEASALNDSVYRGLTIEGKFSVGGQVLTHRVYFQPEYVAGISIVRKWVFPSISGSATDTFTFVTTSGSQGIDGKTLTGSTIYVGTATGRNIFQDADGSGGTRQFTVGFNTGFPNIGVSTPTFRLPPLSTVSDLHTFAVVHAASATPFPAGSIIYGNSAGTEFDALTNGNAGDVLVSGGGTAAPSWASPSGLAVEHSSTTDRDAYTVNCTTNGTTAVTSAALFGPVQVGHAIYGVGIPAGTTVTLVTDASNITISQAATDSTTNVRNFASDDHTQLIRKYGPTGQYIGVQPAVGTVSAGGLHMSGFLSVGSAIPSSTTETVRIQKTVTGVLTNFVNLSMIHGGTGSVGSTHKALVVLNSGAPLRSAGSPSFTGIDVSITPNCPSGLTDNILLGINMSAISTLGGGSVINQVTGVNATCGASGTGSITLMQAAVYTLQPQATTVGSIRAIELVSSSVNVQTGTVTNMFGIYMDTLASAATISGAGAITNFYGIYRSTGVSTAVTNKFFIYLDADIPSIHRGTLRLGDNTVATHFLEIVAGTTTKAPIRLTSATPITTAVAGCIEFQTDDFFATITTGAARKAFVLDDGSRLTSGRVPYATTNGRLTDTADLTWDNANKRLGINIASPAEELTVAGQIQQHNQAATRYRGTWNQTGTDLVFYSFDDTGAVELPVSIGLNRYVIMDNPNGANLRIVAGTATVVPFKLTSGTNLTTAVAGGVEYDGTFFYLTHGDAVRTKSVTQRGQLNLTAQAAAIGATTLYTPQAAGYFVVHYTLEDTAADITAGTIQFQVNYTDDIGATNQTGATLALTATGRDRGSFQIWSNSGAITYQTNLVGIIGTAQYALRARLEFLG